MAANYPGMYGGRCPAPIHANSMSYYPITDFQQGYGAASMYPEIEPHQKLNPAMGFRKRLNTLALSSALFLPWLLFCGVLAIMSFSPHYNNPQSVYAAVAIGLVVVFSWGGGAVVSLKNRDYGAEPTWYAFMFFTGLLAWAFAMCLGNSNFFNNLQPFYDVSNLNIYRGVDPAAKHGQQMMDAGRIVFQDGAKLDLRRAWSFKNQDTYCVAPISKVDENGTMSTLSNYDFWAVGLNCCSGNGQDFHCGEFDNPQAHAGLRLTRDDVRPFFRLAVQQAQSAHNLKAIHPLFLYWMTDPVNQAHDYEKEGYKCYLLGICAHFSLQLVLVIAAGLTFAKRSFWEDPDYVPPL